MEKKKKVHSKYTGFNPLLTESTCTPWKAVQRSLEIFFFFVTLKPRAG